jgi:RNA polymerase sigma factor (sigma-70 family)
MGTEVSGGRFTAMANAMTTSVARQIESLFAGGSIAGLSDRQLIERFVAGRNSPAAEAAFAALVARHGPMVLNVCRQLLGDRHHAEDAFQAVFLVLARKARSLRDPDLLGPWLYGVALRTARKARARLARIRKGEQDGAARRPDSDAADPADRSLIERERAEALHAEIDRLPESSRRPVVLCYFEGLSLSEAAKRLRCPAGTVHSRLDRAREKLRRSLLRRGIALSGTALAASLAPRSASASVPPLLCDSTARAAIAFVARRATGGALSAPAAALAQEVLHTMLIHTLKAAALCLVTLATLTTGVGYVTNSPAALSRSREGEPPGEPIVKGARTEPRPPGVAEDSTRPAPGRMTVAGRVLDPDGRPIAGAVVDVITRFRTPRVSAREEDDQGLTLLGQGRSDGDGRFRLDAPRTAAARVYRVYALAAAPGYGLGWAELNPDAEQSAADVRLFPEQAVLARLVDVNGSPAAGVEVRVLGMGQPGDHGTFAGITFWGGEPAGLRAWPRPVKTDDHGRIAIRGIGRGLGFTLEVRDPRFAQQVLRIEGAERAADKEITLALAQARFIEGRVLAADSGRPIPGAMVDVAASRGQYGGMYTSRFRADDQGHFTANPSPGEYFRVYAHAPDGQPYPVPEVEFAWPKGAVKKELDIRLPRGVLIRGTVTDAATGRALPSSSIQYIPVGALAGDSVLSGWQAMVASREDGSFQIAVPPGKGHLLVFGPTGDYVLAEIGSRRLFNDRPGGQRYRAHAIIPYEVKAGDPPREVAAALRPGATIQGRIEGPDGQTVTGAFVITALRVEPTHPSWLARDQMIPARDGRFELHGLDPRGSARISVLDPDHEWGATVDISGKPAGEDLTIRLQPCGRARVRFVAPDGRPVTRPEAVFEFVATPGRSAYGRRGQAGLDELAADADFLANVDRKHYWDDPRTDADGRFTMISLIPGALYRISDFSTVNQEKGIQVRKDFTVGPGETVDLGDILIEKPPA